MGWGQRLTSVVRSPSGRLTNLQLWHLVARRVRPRRTDASRRTLLRLGLLGVVGGALYAVAPQGSVKRFTGYWVRLPLSWWQPRSQ